MLSGFSNITEFFNKSIQKINFKDVQHAIKAKHEYILINTLLLSEQDCLIQGTLPCELEEKTVNDLLNNYDLTRTKFVVYGRNSADDSAEKKYKQLVTLGFSYVYLYGGGMFEWMLLQDIYGCDEFPTTRKVLDILRFSGGPKLAVTYR
jgi:hypothetical protein